MRRVVAVSLLAVALLFVSAPPSYASGGHGGRGFHGHPGFHGHFRGHGVIVVGPTFWWGPWWYYPPPYYYSPQVVVQPAPIIVGEYAQAYWYYCPSFKAYYPTVPTCPEVWIKVPPRAQ